MVQQEKEAVGSGGGSTREVKAVAGEEKRKHQGSRRRMTMKANHLHHHDENEEPEDEEEENDEGNKGCERQREHPFIVTEPGEVARGKKNGLDYLFHLYEQCREFLIQVQTIAKDRGEKCPTKVILALTLILFSFRSFFFSIFVVTRANRVSVLCSS